MDDDLTPAPRDGYLPVEGGALYYRDTGEGLPVVVLHGGPDFDHRYLLPDLDRLADTFRLIYYDQRGRGNSVAGVRPEDVSITSEMGDLEALRQHFGLETVSLLGHSWGTVLALEYALRHPDRVSHLILMNPAPASHADRLLFRQELLQHMPDDIARMEALFPGHEAAYESGDPAAVAVYYRVYFRHTLWDPEEHLDRVVTGLGLGPTAGDILRVRAIEDRLMAETTGATDYDLLPKLADVTTPSLVIHGASDVIPLVCARHIAEALPDGRLVVLDDCGHFAYLERPEEVFREIAAFVVGRA